MQSTVKNHNNARIRSLTEMGLKLADSSVLSVHGGKSKRGLHEVFILIIAPIITILKKKFEVYIHFEKIYGKFCIL
jgi:hypothetical protein